MLRSRVLPALALLALAAGPLAHAQTASTTPGGIAATPLWASEAAPVAGDTLTVSTIVLDNGTVPISGIVGFSVDGTAIGSPPFTLAVGGSKIVSVTWPATVGTHSLTASITSAMDTSANQPVTLENQVATGLEITVAPAPVPVAQASVPYLGAATGVAGTVVNTALAAVNSAREAGATYFAAQLAKSAPAKPAAGASGTTANKGLVLGTSTVKSLPAAAYTTNSGDWIDEAFFTIFNTPYLFYPLLILLVFLVLWIFGRFRRRR